MPKYKLPHQFKIVHVLINALSWRSSCLLAITNYNLVTFGTFITCKMSTGMPFVSKHLDSSFSF